MKRRALRLAPAWLTLLSGLLALLGAELLLRQAPQTGWPSSLADPGVIADPLCHDRYWQAWAHSPGFSQPLRVHTPRERDHELGWTADRDSLNPLGAGPSPRWVPGKLPRIALFGDSFIQGTAGPGTAPADALQELLPETQVLNYGVAGYGLDQTLLHLERQARKLSGQQVVIGVLTTNLDRSILKVRSAPKPWFSLDPAGALTLHQAQLQDTSAPVPPPQLSSYLGSAVSLHLPRMLRLEGAEDCRREEKTLLTRALMGRLKRVCEASDLRCVVLSLPWLEDLQSPPSWRELLIRETAAAEDLPLLEARDLLQDLDWTRLYGPDRHLSAAGNRLLGRWLGESLQLQVDEAGENELH